MTVDLPLTHEYYRLGRCKTECLLWAVHRADGDVLRFTNHCAKITFSEPGEWPVQNDYTPVSSLLSQAISSESGLKTRDSELIGVLAAGGVTAEDFAAGRYDHAEVHRYVVDWMVPFLGPAAYDTFFFGETSMDRDEWTAEVVGLTALLEQKRGSIYESTCEYTWADNMAGTDLEETAADQRMCGLFARAHRRPNAQVSQVTSQTTFRLSSIPATVEPVTERSPIADGHFNQGRLKGISGNNVGLWADIKTYDHTNKEFVLQQPLPETIEVNDTFDLWAGCGKKLLGVAGGAQGCIDFNNAPRFGGFLIPGRDELRTLPSRFGS